MAAARPNLRPRITSDRHFRPAMVMLVITRDSLNKIPKRCLAHEMEILEAIFGPENVNAVPHDPTMLPTVAIVDGERLEGEAAQRASLRRTVLASAEFGRLAQCYGIMPESRELWVNHVFGADFRSARFQEALEAAEAYEPVISGLDIEARGGTVEPVDYHRVKADPGRQPALDKLRDQHPDAFERTPTPVEPEQEGPPPIVGMTKAQMVGELTTLAVRFDPAATKADLADVLEEARARAELGEDVA